MAATLPGWLRAVPLFLSGLLFVSAFFSLFSPLPLIFSNLRFGRIWAWAAAVTNTGIVLWASGAPSAGVYLATVLPVALVLPELMRFKVSLQRAWTWTFAALSLAGFLAISVVAQVHQIGVAEEIRSQFRNLADLLIQSMPSAGMQQEVSDPEVWRKDLLREIPSMIGVFGLILVWVNLVLAARLREGVRSKEEGGISLEGLRAWKAPEWLVWPTIAAGFILVFQSGGGPDPLGDIALNLFKFLMAIYAIQGLCVMSSLMQTWNIRAGLRTGIMAFAVLLMLPLVLSLGFFDLWFDFRSKFRQS